MIGISLLRIVIPGGAGSKDFWFMITPRLQAGKVKIDKVIN